MNKDKTQEELTPKQMNALYKYFELNAEELNRRGHDISNVLSKAKVDIMWTKENFKVNIWHEIQEAMYKTRSTSKLKKQNQIDSIVDVITSFMAKNFPDVEHIPFPEKCDWCDAINSHKPSCPEYQSQ